VWGWRQRVERSLLQAATGVVAVGLRLMGGAAWLGQLLRAGYAVQLRGGKAEAQMVYTI
jgi:TRAP-type mannitol/chloroaromatic compound transport system permease large subunit